jgi:hypothetical protein
MRLYIPTIGDKLILTADWNFTLCSERRNHAACAYFGLELNPSWYLNLSDVKTKAVKFSAGDILKVDRIFIRKGAPEFDSISFYVEFPKEAGQKKRKGFLFWAKLSEVNTIECERVK